MSLEPVPTAGGPDVLPNPILEPEREPPKPDPTPEPSPIPPVPEPAPAFSAVYSGLNSTQQQESRAGHVAMGILWLRNICGNAGAAHHRRRLLWVGCARTD